MKIERFIDNPIISPTQNWWEINATFNPGATIFQEKVLLLYRAIGGDSFSRFGIATSSDGYHFERYSEPIFEADINNPLERLGVEDPRISKIDDTYYICYTAPSVYPASSYRTEKFAPSLTHPAPWRVRPSLITTKDFKTFDREGVLLDFDTKDAAFFPEKVNNKFCLLHRPYPDLVLTFSQDLKNWTKETTIISPRKGLWDSERVGSGSAPIKTTSGWLVFYHGTNKQHHYMLGVLLLDINDPTKVLYRSSEPLLMPETPYEKNGLTPNVVFASGVIEKSNTFFIYYGAGDKTVALATLDKEELLEQLRV